MTSGRALAESFPAVTVDDLFERRNAPFGY